MAQKRMFDKRITDSDRFMDLPNSSKALYFMAGMSADDRGFFQPRRLQKMCGFTDDDFKVLIAKKYLIPFESGVMVITDWNKNNYLDKNRITETEYLDEINLLKIINEKYELNTSNNVCLTDVKPMFNQYSIVENSIVENSIDKISSSNNNIYNIDVAKIDKLMIECLNTTNTNNTMECISYLDKLPIELIEYALKKTARTQHPSWKYAMTILDDYVRRGFKTLEEVKGDELSFKSKQQPIQETDEERIKRLTREMEERMSYDT